MLRPLRLLKDPTCLSRQLSTLQRQSPATSLVSNKISEAANALRQQHQLVVNEDTGEEHREALRLFVGALHTRLARSRITFAPPTLPAFPAEWIDDIPRRAIPADTHMIEQQSQAVATTEKVEVSAPLQDQQDFDETALHRAIRKRNHKAAMRLYQEARADGYSLPRQLLYNLFSLALRSNPILAYSILKDYHQDPKTKHNNMFMYRKLCSSIATLNRSTLRGHNIRGFMEELLTDVEQMEASAQQDLYSKLILSLTTQRSVALGQYARIIYERLAMKEAPMTNGWLKKLLSLSKYTRQDDVPFHDVLARLAEQKGRPHPFSIIPAIHNMFPFTNAPDMCIALNALLQLQSDLLDSEFDHVLIDMDCLESIASGAAHAGSSEMMLLVWDLVEQCNYEPTESLYESTIVAFFSSEDTIDAAFGALVSMKEDGFEVSRSLLRSISLALRSKRELILSSLHFLQSNAPLVSVDSLHVLMSCFAERGDVRECKGILDLMPTYGLQPDVNSYSFYIEALGKDIHRREKRKNPAMIQRNFNRADSILSMMEGQGIAPSGDVVRNYVELLCLAGEVSTATTVVKDCLETIPEAVNSKTLYRVSIANADEDNFDVAREMADHITDNIPVLMRKIRSKEQRAQHLNHAWLTPSSSTQ